MRFKWIVTLMVCIINNNDSSSGIFCGIYDLTSHVYAKLILLNIQYQVTFDLGILSYYDHISSLDNFTRSGFKYTTI